MAIFSDLVATTAEQLYLPTVTVESVGKRARSAGLISKYGRGPNAAQMTARDAAVLLIGCCIAHERGASFEDELSEACAARLEFAGIVPYTSRELEPQIRGALHFIVPLSIGRFENHNVLAGLTSIIDDMRNGTFDKWANGQTASVFFELHQIDRALTVFIDRAGLTAGLLYHERRADDVDDAIRVERVVRVRTPVFRSLANLLGPPPPE